MAKRQPLPDGFTHWCGGDLGIVCNDRVVAMLFVYPGEVRVHDLVQGGEPEVFTKDDEAHIPAPALNLMLEIVTREVCAKDDADLAKRRSLS